ncbi:hypothetical protein EJ04DRAFT_157681 [Polyplosphaeria fusca]|uniref:Uncharacterized protein n=1 Tax=Polyplosphaeria fusca TaxID=682080 RepID=A0A9P4V1N8_9PLEO|nr:hypothetical protein EJ04DRAFT_157681 [Polyplosphaeria fusca]
MPTPSTPPTPAGCVAFDRPVSEAAAGPGPSPHCLLWEIWRVGVGSGVWEAGVGTLLLEGFLIGASVRDILRGGFTTCGIGGRGRAAQACTTTRGWQGNTKAYYHWRCLIVRRRRSVAMIPGSRIRDGRIGRVLEGGKLILGTVQTWRQEGITRDGKAGLWGNQGGVLLLHDNLHACMPSVGER